MVNWKRFRVYWVNLSVGVGKEINKTRPCVVISPEIYKPVIQTVIVAPMTTKGFSFPTRVPVVFSGRPGYVVLDQLRAIDTQRLGDCLGALSVTEQECTMAVLRELLKVK